MDIAKTVKDSIDQYIESKTKKSNNRAHLGASVLGYLCDREIWYAFRFAKPTKPNARMARLFERGHLEEYRFEEWLKNISDKFWSTNPKTGEQFRISNFEGHFGGSLDGIIRNPAGIKGDFLTEFKTHNEKSFKSLITNGVRSSKPEHYAQMQIYLYHSKKLQGALYFAICKNDDSLYVEYVERDEETAKKYLQRASDILQSNEPPKQHDSAGEFNFYCKSFCPFSDLCFNNAEPERTCRSCIHAQMVEEGGWRCNKYDKLLSLEEQKQGCNEYERLF